MFRYGLYSYELLLSKEYFDLYLYIGYILFEIVKIVFFF